jgi:hypothetical protein
LYSLESSAPLNASRNLRPLAENSPIWLRSTYRIVLARRQAAGFRDH